LFVFPFDRDEPSAATAVEEIAAALCHIEPTTLLFLRHIERIRTRGPQAADTVLERVDGVGPTSSSRHVVLANSRDRGHGDEEWLVWHRQLTDCGHPGQRVEIAFRASTENGGPQPVKSDISPLVVFFPTARETFLGFLTQGPYRTTPARDNIPEHDPWNQTLVRETATLLTDVLCELRDEGLLTVQVLLAMPLDHVRFQPGSMFHPLYDAVADAVTEDELIPVSGGGYGKARDIKLARGAGLRELLTPDQLGELYQGAGPLRFAHEAITENQTPLLWDYLSEEIEVDEVTPTAVVTRLTSGFLAAQPDKWLALFYAFLHQNQALWRAPRYRGEQPGPARGKPIIRLEDGRQVAPFLSGGRPAAYLPGPAETEFLTVRRAVADFPEARQFLEALKYTEPDVIAEVLDKVVPRYRDLDVKDLDQDQHRADLDRIARAVAVARTDQQQQLREQLRQAAFLVGENAATGERRLMRPTGLYWRTEALATYFRGNPDAWFALDSYRPWSDRLSGLGIRTEPAVYTRTQDYFGYVTIVDDRGNHERGVDGFDPGAEIDGLAFALRHPDRAKSAYVWNVLLAPNRHLVAGVTEWSSRQGFANPSRSSKTSSIGVAAMTEAWLPSPEGTFRRPGELQVNDLPSGYKRDEVLAAALGMIQPVVEEVSRQLGLPPDLLLGLSAYPDLVAEIQQKLKERSAFSGGDQEDDAEDDDDAEASSEQMLDYTTALADVFQRPVQPTRDGAGPAADPAPGTVSNPEFRRERVQRSIEDDKEAEPAIHERFQRVPRRVWEAKDGSMRQFLAEQYAGRCQICDQTFTKRNGAPYFEGLYLVARTQARWIDRPGNVICLCATCCAKFQFGVVQAPDILQQITAWRTQREGGSDTRLTLDLCGEHVAIRFTEKHLLDLQEIIKAEL